MVFNGVSITLGRITPIVLGNELLQAALLGTRGSAQCPRIEPAPRAVELPLILGRLGRSTHIDAVLHGKADVILSICKSSNLRYRPLGNNFGNENYTSPVLAPFFAANVES